MNEDIEVASIDLTEDEIVAIYNLTIELEKMGFSFADLCNKSDNTALNLKHKIINFVKARGSEWMRSKNCKPW